MNRLLNWCSLEIFCKSAEEMETDISHGSKQIIQQKLINHSLIQICGIVFFFFSFSSIRQSGFKRFYILQLYIFNYLFFFYIYLCFDFLQYVQFRFHTQPFVHYKVFPHFIIQDANSVNRTGRKKVLVDWCV